MIGEIPAWFWWFVFPELVIAAIGLIALVIGAIAEVWSGGRR